MNKRQVSETWRYIAVILTAVTVALCVALFTVINTKINLAREEAQLKAAGENVGETVPETVPAEEAETEAAEVIDISGKAMLGYWSDSAPLKQQLTAYVERVTDENNSSFIPVDRRIAVFDLDGTLFCETDPIYFVYALLIHRVTEDEGYKDEASKFEKQTVDKLIKHIEKGTEYENLDDDVGLCIASSFSGITEEELDDYVQAFKTLPMPGYEGLLRGDGWYLPMIQVVNYLEAHDFTVYIISGTDRMILRSIVHNSPVNVPNSHLIGSDRTITASGQGETDDMEYIFGSEDKILTGGKVVTANVQMNKVKAIVREIGVKPVLSFGNSTGDASMEDYVISGNQYESLAFMVCCDDLDRENGNLVKAQQMYDMSKERNWIPISMKNDWTTIYGEGVTRKPAVVDAAG